VLGLVVDPVGEEVLDAGRELARTVGRVLLGRGDDQEVGEDVVGQAPERDLVAARPVADPLAPSGEAAATHGVVPLGHRLSSRQIVRPATITSAARIRATARRRNCSRRGGAGSPTYDGSPWQID
jgi:hypothetical protein